MSVKGVDVSQFQGTINFDILKGGVDFVILRAGYGGGGKDSQFIRNRDEARRLGIPRQFYFYAYPGRSSGAAQAQEFFNLVGKLQAGESISLDMEDDVTYGRRLVASDVQWSLEFLQECEKLFGVKGLLYINTDVKGRFDWKPVKNANYGLWQANYGANNGQPGTEPSPSPWDFNAIWQYSSKANMGGISPVDANIFNGTIDQFLKYGLQGSAPTPTPDPTPTPTPPSTTTYKIKPNDTFWDLENKNGWSHGTLQNLNPGVNPNTLQIGQVINVPGSGSSGGGQSGNNWNVPSPVPGYVTAQDAINGKNSNSIVPAGTYAIYNKVNGAVNVTRQAGVPGWWIKA